MRASRDQTYACAPVMDALHTWMIGQRQLIPEGSAIAKALDYSACWICGQGNGVFTLRQMFNPVC